VPDETQLQACLELLHDPDHQLKAAHMLISVCMEVRIKEGIERRPSERTAVASLLSAETEGTLLTLLDRVPPLVRRKLAFVLGELGGRWLDEKVPAVVAALAQVAQLDSDPDVRAAAIDALGKLGGPGAVDALEEFARQDLVPTNRVHALFARENLAPKSERPIRGAATVDQLLTEMSQEDDRDVGSVARELGLRRRERQQL
jgi:HEAT repeat protein